MLTLALRSQERAPWPQPAIGCNSSPHTLNLLSSMDREQFERMSTDELWEIHTLVTAVLTARIVDKKNELERRLEMLERQKEPSHRPEN